LGEREVPEHADQRRGQAARLVPEDRGDSFVSGAPARQLSRGCSTIGRISTGPPGHALAISSASSRSLTSTRAKPPMTSFASMNGPSVTVTFPFLRETVVAVLGPWSSSPPTTLPAFVYCSNHLPDSAYAAIASSRALPVSCSTCSIVPPNNRTYFIAQSPETSGPCAASLCTTNRPALNRQS